MWKEKEIKMLYSQNIYLRNARFTLNYKFVIFSQFHSVQSLSHVRLFVSPWTTASQAFLSIINSQKLPKLMSIELMMTSYPLSFPSPPALNLSQHQGLFKWFSCSHQVAKVLRVSASTSVFPVNTQDWIPLGWTCWISLESTGLSRVFSNTKVEEHQFLYHSAFFIVQLSHPYMITGKTITFTAAAAAKLLQSCLTLCDPIDGSPPGSTWDSPGKNTGVGCHFLLQLWLDRPLLAK